MEQIKVISTKEIPSGTYSGITSGHVSEFKVNNIVYRAEFSNGVKGFGYSDAVCVSSDGTVHSSILGYAIGLKRMKIVWEEM